MTPTLTRPKTSPAIARMRAADDRRRPAPASEGAEDDAEEGAAALPAAAAGCGPRRDTLDRHAEPLVGGR